MFGKNSEADQLKQQVAALQEQLKTSEQNWSQSLKTLRQHVASLACGLPISPFSVLNGLGYSELPKEKVAPMIAAFPNLLVLDVRGDEGWAQGHIPQAKHVPAAQVFQRLDEFPDRHRPILTLCANGNTAVSVCQLLVREGYLNVYNALGGMAGYTGPLTKPEVAPSKTEEVRGEDPELIAQVLQVMDRDIRPGLKRDGGDLQVLAVEEGIVKIKMTGACVGCGAQKRTVEDGIKTHLKKMIPGVRDVEDHSVSFAK